MKKYDIYYKSTKINTYPLSESTLEEILKKKYIYKRNSKTQEIEKINTENIHCVRCIVV